MKELQITDTSSIKDALKKIDSNDHGLIFPINGKGQVVGLLTDGDIRRQLIEGAKLNDSIKKIINTDFIWADEKTSREKLLKQLDNKIKVIPILDSNKNLIDIVDRNYMPFQSEEPIFSRSRSPVRVSFGGGGSDLTHYFEDKVGATINATISLYSHATLKKRADKKIYIYSKDLDASLSANNFDEAVSKEGKFGLVQAILKAIHPEFGFELYIHSDFPINSGLGGSAAVSAAILGCFNQFRQDRWDLHELSELAFQAERLYLGIAGGWQDQYATVFGGFNFMEYKMDENVVQSLRLNKDTILELEECLVLFDTCLDHQSGDIHDDQKKHMQKSSVLDKVKKNVKLTYKTRNHLLRGQLDDFGNSLNEAWQLKKQFSEKISTESLNAIYNGAMENGAIGGKLLGAGGGGFFLFYAKPFQRHKLSSYLESQGLKNVPFHFEKNGLKSWTTREKK
ncbi:CBS domain-containing protein [Gammaproteobacteria bacterium]|nr:CBS domain-containing protein [Gammaproteobacteria bacterium]